MCHVKNYWHKKLFLSFIKIGMKITNCTNIKQTSFLKGIEQKNFKARFDAEEMDSFQEAYPIKESSFTQPYKAHGVTIRPLSRASRFLKTITGEVEEILSEKDPVTKRPLIEIVLEAENFRINAAIKKLDLSLIPSDKSITPLEYAYLLFSPYDENTSYYEMRDALLKKKEEMSDDEKFNEFLSGAIRGTTGVDFDPFIGTKMVAIIKHDPEMDAFKGLVPAQVNKLLTKIDGTDSDDCGTYLELVKQNTSEDVIRRNVGYLNANKKTVALRSCDFTPLELAFFLSIDFDSALGRNKKEALSPEKAEDQRRKWIRAMSTFSGHVFNYNKKAGKECLSRVVNGYDATKVFRALSDEHWANAQKVICDKLEHKGARQYINSGKFSAEISEAFGKHVLKDRFKRNYLVATRPQDLSSSQ